MNQRRPGDLLRLDTAWRLKLCIGDGNCAHCGCLGGAVGSPLRKLLHPSEILRALA